MISTDFKIKAFQTALGSYPDGQAGPSTWDAGYRFLDAEGYLKIPFPYENYQWGCKVMFGNPDSVVLIDGDGDKRVRDFAYSISGSFTNPSGVDPFSFMIYDGEVIWGRACHANSWDGEKPETVLYWTKDGGYNMVLARTVEDLEEFEPISNIKWAIGGGQIVKNREKVFNNEAEGFVGAFYDVFRKTAHCAIGFDMYGNVMGVYHGNCYLKDFQTKCSNIGMENGIFIDGGHISAINAGSLTANTHQKQGYIVQFGG